MRRNKEQTKGAVRSVLTLMSKGETMASALKKADVGPSQFYRYKNQIQKEMSETSTAPPQLIIHEGDSKPGPKPGFKRPIANSKQCIVILTQLSSLSELLRSLT